MWDLAIFTHFLASLIFSVLSSVLLNCKICSYVTSVLTVVASSAVFVIACKWGDCVKVQLSCLVLADFNSHSPALFRTFCLGLLSDGEIEDPGYAVEVFALGGVLCMISDKQLIIMKISRRQYVYVK